MHILVTNDDGPPSIQSSPYVLPFVRALEEAGHTVSVIVPDQQRSWIGKAHIVGQDVRATFYWPPSETPEIHSDSASTGPPAGAPDDKTQPQPWVLVNSTPAGCAQLGLSHYFFQSRGAIDLVISGPNFGRNTTAVFALSSGTLGAALEAAVCGQRAIAISFAFFDPRSRIDPTLVRESCLQAVRVAEHLAAKAAWPPAQLYSVNVPVKAGVSRNRVVWTRMLQNQWQKGACFQELPAPAVGGPGEEEARLRRQESGNGGAEVSGTQTPIAEGRWRSRHFKWAPRFTDVYESVEKAGPGSDGWAVKEGETSITALKANFMHVDGLEGEVKL